MERMRWTRVYVRCQHHVSPDIMKILRPTLLSLAGAIALVAITLALLVTGGYPAKTALLALWNGSVGSWYALTSATMVRAIPLMESRLWPALSLKNLPDPWSLLTPSSRIEDLRELVQQTVAGAIPRLVNPTFESATFV